jgi:hypothetical protein
MHDCIEHDDPRDCVGEVSYYEALSGSGISYHRCEAGYEDYLNRLLPQLKDISERYPDSPTPPEWFDPSYAGESWDEDY